MTSAELITVVTGDLVDSTTLGASKIAQALEALAASAEFQGAWHGAPLHFTRHRGDGWQVVLRKPEYSLRSALAFRAVLRSLGSDYDSYFGLATDRATGPFGPDLNAETATVFAASGRALDQAKTSAGGRMAYDGRGPNAALATLVDHISQSWTPAQAAAVQHLIVPDARPSLTDVAKALGKSRQAVTKAVEAASLPQLNYALSCIEDLADA